MIIRYMHNVERYQPTEAGFKRIRAGLKLRNTIDRLRRKYRLSSVISGYNACLWNKTY